MSEISEVIASEIADFFAGFGGPGEPDIQSGEAQRLLTERLLSVLALRERAESVPVVPEKCGCWYLVSWCYPGGRYGATEIRLNGPWSTGSMRSATKMIADYNDLGLANVVILSVFPIAAAPGKN
ncbi:hypothetical protein AB8W27_15220 [Cronobacter turicensis]|uniref:Uncharacterized protein n=1 Tax=Cronobacter turicensis (strain DSM 18703 / CCUG 55852 / LMG 23827 / z3032) TaxID=693216 RepID=C9XXY5_CROTZ|nr:hypothetical protein [Cronobacter turicensis]MDI6470684.1 hypothetical protein [Cronobacter turicensis]CBA28840.1 unknown protein [Cronobacter turicensis z3032]